MPPGLAPRPPRGARIASEETWQEAVGLGREGVDGQAPALGSAAARAHLARCPPVVHLVLCNRFCSLHFIEGIAKFLVIRCCQSLSSSALAFGRLCSSLMTLRRVFNTSSVMLSCRTSTDCLALLNGSIQNTSSRRLRRPFPKTGTEDVAAMTDTIEAAGKSK